VTHTDRVVSLQAPRKRVDMRSIRAERTIRRLLAAGLYVLALAVVGAVLFSVLSVGGLPGGYRPLLVLTGSMEPAVKTGSLIVIRTVDAVTVSEGDVITFRPSSLSGFDTAGHEASFLTHRVERVEAGPAGPKFITRGDANTVADPVAVSPNQVVGRVVLVSHLAGQIAWFLRSPVGLAVLALGALASAAPSVLHHRRRRPSIPILPGGRVLAPRDLEDSSPSTVV
jgi:signal peptidase